MNSHLHPIFQEALAGFVQPSKRWMAAADVKEGDILCYGHHQPELVVERITVREFDGAIGLHGNNDTWSVWYAPHYRVRVKRASLLAPI